MKVSRSAVMFDLYGTLADIEVDEESRHFWDSLAAKFFLSEAGAGQAVRDSYRRLSEQETKRRGEGFILDAVFTKLLAEFGLNADRDSVLTFSEVFRRTSIVMLRRKPYTGKLLKVLKDSGYRLGLVSNTEALLTAHDLRALGISAKFDQIVLSSELGFKKPSREIFDVALERMNVEASESVFVGDNFSDDIVGAVNSGIDAIFLTRDTDPGECAGRYSGRVLCAGFSYRKICEALKSLGCLIDGLK